MKRFFDFKKIKRELFLRDDVEVIFVIIITHALPCLFLIQMKMHCIHLMGVVMYTLWFNFLIEINYINYMVAMIYCLKNC